VKIQSDNPLLITQFKKDFDFLSIIKIQFQILKLEVLSLRVSLQNQRKFSKLTSLLLLHQLYIIMNMKIYQQF
jgi:hypothetical protein